MVYAAYVHCTILLHAKLVLVNMQDAEIGDQYDEFPAVLQLHLKRFEYDFERDIRVKVRRMAAVLCS